MNTQDMNSMVTQATSAGKIKKGGKHAKNIKSDTNPTASTDDGHIYVIDCLNLGETAHDSDSDSKWLPVQGRKNQMENKENSNVSNTHKCNVLSIFLTRQNAEQLKIVITQQ